MWSKPAADPFPDDLSGDGRPGAGLSPGAAENVSGSGGESSGIHLRFLFPEHSTSGAAFPGFLRDSETVNFTFYGGERVWGSIDMNKNVTAVVTLTLYSSAFLCEIVRGALNSVDMRQMEAAHALGMTKRQAYFRIIIPQAIIVALPELL